jgi:hypothetical protein
MRTLLIRVPALSVILIAALLLTGCPAPTPVTPTAVPATPTPFGAAPTAPAPDGWTAHTSGDIAISLPDDWEVLALSQGDLQGIFADFQKTNPELARIIGSAEALQGVALWAFRIAGGDAAGGDAAGGDAAGGNAAFADNLNIRRSPLGEQKVTSMADVTPAIVDQYRQLGFAVDATETDLQIGDRPAAHIAFSYPVTLSDGTTAVLNGHQYLVATPTDLWILSYSAGPGNEAALAPVFERSAGSFRVKQNGD